MAMFGAYAKALQNSGKVLEDWLAASANWQHLWSESIVSFDHTGSSVAAEASTLATAGIPGGLLTQGAVVPARAAERAVRSDYVLQLGRITSVCVSTSLVMEVCCGRPPLPWP